MPEEITELKDTMRLLGTQSGPTIFCGPRQAYDHLFEGRAAQYIDTLLSIGQILGTPEEMELPA
jgi:hypothetical protein